MQGRNPSTAIPDPDQKRKQRLRMLRNCTIVVLVVVLIVLAVNLVRYFTRSRSIGVYSLPCFAHQHVTVFRAANHTMASAHSASRGVLCRGSSSLAEMKIE